MNQTHFDFFIIEVYSNTLVEAINNVTRFMIFMKCSNLYFYYQ